ncbi:aspartyl/glutamyl-tRNA(Asn/Gln) amidotransferase subunit C [Hydrogenivirga caldilitoris]|uniref:Aspartyl/glutamyl-tRNA(Asn/Gln) amidotransferase subunit C n=1 Tax=Hydrogenivirga caldilitoris TaxID=246264 RepID=A0A497XQV8_9AQUI|nr:Asp-tRNA(Asn)/Glu-tRNA(Gln) amidotransferase subunit GatC [Hydrogenivirga caldilitoris]RLJ71377.1 aspartyl/glutamyl-tRNA(Asn/Gln) amidotransferase subunit C [Hydrogenivirga caldilitoris]
MVDRGWVQKIALLARLKLTEEEVELFSRQLGDILSFVQQLEELDTSGVEPYLQNIEETPMREDEPKGSLTHEEALKNAPERENGFFVVPRIVEV